MAANRTWAGAKEWSGNYLNWAATHTIDPFRLALTGGYRVRDTATETWLEKARHDRDALYPDRKISSGVGNATPAEWDSLSIRIRALGNKMYIAPGDKYSGDRGGEGLPGSGATPYDPAKHTLEMRDRSEERRVGKECVRTSRSRWEREHKKKK